MMKTPLALTLCSLFVLSACTEPNPNAYPNQPNARAQNGAIIGALAGGFLGANAGGDDRLVKTVLGAGSGAAVGGAIGNELDKQAADLRGSIGNSSISVTNTGQYLIVNMPQDLLFATDSAALRPDLTSDIRAVAASILRYPNSTVEVIGHTDNTGSAAYNQDLSQRRAVSVANILRESGVPNARIDAFGRGEDQPIASNQTTSGMAQNRRVEIIIRPTA